MGETRRYDDPCGIARALDVIGDRWALLIVRELIFGPRRFLQLRSGLHSVSPNVLSQRLRDLEEAGVVSRRVLDPPASVAVYELTDRGRALEPVLLDLGRWGSQQPITTSNEMSPDALLVALKTCFDPDAAAAGVYALDVAGDWFTVIVSAGSVTVSRGRAIGAAVTLRGDVGTMRAVAFGRQPIAEAEGAGRLRVTGDRALAECFTRMFPAPQMASAQARAMTRGSPSSV
jgi:DNA-binding HxlR family transcriptional regulator